MSSTVIGQNVRYLLTAKGAAYTVEALLRWVVVVERLKG